MQLTQSTNGVQIYRFCLALPERTNGTIMPKSNRVANSSWVKFELIPALGMPVEASAPFARVCAYCFVEKQIASLFILVVVFPCSVNAPLCVRVAQKITRLRAATSVKVVNRLYCATPPIFRRVVALPSTSIWNLKKYERRYGVLTRCTLLIAYFEIFKLTVAPWRESIES